MFLMSRKIKALGVKMVLSGEGSDEIFGGYLYFHKAPNKEEFHKETCRKVCVNLFLQHERLHLNFLSRNSFPYSTSFVQGSLLYVTVEGSALV